MILHPWSMDMNALLTALFDVVKHKYYIFMAIISDIHLIDTTARTNAFLRGFHSSILQFVHLKFIILLQWKVLIGSGVWCLGL